MKRLTLRLTEEVHEKLREESFNTGISMNDIILELIEDKYDLSASTLDDIKIYTNMIGSQYDVYDILEEVKRYTGIIPVPEIQDADVLEKVFYSNLKKLAINRGYLLIWIQQKIDGKIIIGNFLNKPDCGVIGFGIAPKEKELELSEKLKNVEEELKNISDEEYNKAQKEYWIKRVSKY